MSRAGKGQPGRSRALVLCLLVLAILSGGCAEPKLGRLPADAVILAFGDSLTAGVGAAPGATYPEVLARLTGRQVINGGVSGEVTAQGLERLRRLLPEVAPDLLVLLEGGNDILRSKSPVAIRDNLAAMISLAQDSGAQVVLVGVPNKLLFSGAAPLYTELAEEFRLPYDGSTLPDLVRDNRYKSDAIHLNAAGYRQLAEAVYRLLVEEGAL